MSRFRVGDHIVANQLADKRYSITNDGWRGIVLRATKNNEFRASHMDGTGNFGLEEKYFDLITQGDTPVARRTFKQLKDSVTVKKNALWQEACDDGTQEYILLDSADNKDSRNTQRIYDRSLVEDNASNFVEVFAVTPSYMTREELDRWEAFQSQRQSLHVSHEQRRLRPLRR